MKCICRIGVVLIGILFFSPVFAQQMLFRNYSVMDGLASNTVWCISQDDKGYLWLGTKNGISRFDGYEFKSYQFNKNNPKSLGSNFIVSLVQVDQEHYWVGTQNGAYIFDLKTETFESIKALQHLSIYHILKDKKGDLWIGTKSEGLFHYQTKSKKFKKYKHLPGKNSISSNHIRSLAQDKSGKIWLGNFGTGVDVFDPVRQTFQNLNTSNSALSNNFVLTLYADLEGNIWAGTFSGGLNFWKRGATAFKSYKKSAGNSINDDIVRAIYQPTAGKLYIGTEKGLNLLNLKTGQFSAQTKRINDPFSLTDNAIYTIFPDREGGIWIGTFFGGVNYFQEQSSGFELYYPNGEKHAMSGNAVSSFLEDSPGKFWIGTEDGGLNYFNAADRTFKQYPFDSKQQKLSYHNIHSLYKDRKGNIWIGTFSGGLNILNPSTGAVKKYRNHKDDVNSISNDNVYSIYEDKDGLVWLGTTRGLNTYNASKDNFNRVKELGLDVNIVYDIYEDDAKTIWFATYDIGLISLNKRTGAWKQYTTKQGLSSNKIISLLDDHTGSLWLGTDGGGLNRLNLTTGAIEVFDDDAGLHGNVVYGILQDETHTLWLSTNNGLYHFISSKKLFKPYTNWDNLQSRQFNYGAFYKSSTGKLYFGGIKGFNSFYPDSIRLPEPSKNISITNFQLFNKNVTLGEKNSPLKELINYSKEIELSYSQSVISLDYAAQSYIAPNKMHYAYKMHGFDKNWNFVGNQRKATYTNLPPGKYVFTVEASYDPDDIDPARSSLTIIINPPFYRTVWAYLFYGFAGFGLFWAFRNYLIQKTKKENQIKLERIKTKKEQEFYAQKIEFFVAMAHEIRTPLSLIMAPLEKLLGMKKWSSEEQKQLSVMDENSNRLLDLVNQLLDFRRIESDIYTIHKEETELVGLIHLIYSRFSAITYQKDIKFTLSTKISRLLVQIDPEAFIKIMNNLLINAFKFTRTKVKIKIEEPGLHSDGKYYFSVSVEDDGIGIPASEIDNIFTKFFKVSSGDHHYSNLGGTGIGLALAKSLTEKHEGVLEVNSEEQVNTIFKVYIPYAPKETKQLIQNIPGAENGLMPEEQEERTTVMVVEDDPSMIDFIVHSLQSEGYAVVGAGNGAEALQLLEKTAVDLIISDVMMPIMDGMEFCSKVKTNINYSHIPLILLTARSNSESEISGIENGADAYLVKPFKWKHLIAVIKNLLESRARLKNRFAEQPFTTGNSLTTNSRDRKFIERVIEVIEERITDSQLSVEELSKAMNMSRSSLHKKLKSLSGYVPNEFIRLIRLKQAAKLILADEYNISEISYMTGFNSHSYFSKCFIQQFKIAPSEFLEKHHSI